MECNMSYQGQIWVPPVNTNFTNLNSPYVQTVGNNIAMSIISTTNLLAGQYTSAPSTPYCITANIVQNPGDYLAGAYSQITIGSGMGFYDGTKLVVLMIEWNTSDTMAMNVYECSSVSSLTSVWGQRITSGYPTSMLNWIQIRDDGTNIIFSVATDAGPNSPSNWQYVYQQNRTSFLSNVNYVFWGGFGNNTINETYGYFTLNSWQTTLL